MNPFPLYLSAALTRFNKTQEAFARDLGVSNTTVSRWINGRTTPNNLTKQAISNLLERYENELLANAS
jgi:transcriptional regulator with XRE-family HTH domain